MLGFPEFRFIFDRKCIEKRSDLRKEAKNLSVSFRTALLDGTGLAQDDVAILIDEECELAARSNPESVPNVLGDGGLAFSGEGGFHGRLLMTCHSMGIPNWLGELID